MSKNDLDIELDGVKSDELWLRTHETKKFFANPQKDSQAIRGIEAYSQLLPPIMKFGRIFRLRKTTNEMPKTGIMLKQFLGTAFVPLVRSSSEVMDSVKLFFGTGMYKRMMSNYVFPKKTVYKNPFIPGSKRLIKVANVEDYLHQVKRGLPDLLGVPSYMIRNLKNTIFDFSTILSETLPTREMCRKPVVLANSHELILQTVARLCFTASDDILPLYTDYKSSLPPIGDQFKNIIIPYKIKSTDPRIATLLMNPNQKTIAVAFRRNPDIASDVGMIKFVVNLLSGDLFPESTLQAELARKIKEKEHVVFMFHNGTHAFYIDVAEFFEKAYKFDTIYRYIRTSLKTLLALNAGLISAMEVDDQTTASDDDAGKMEAELDNRLKISAAFNKELENQIKPNAAIQMAVVKKFDNFNIAIGAKENDDDEDNIEMLLAKAKTRFDAKVNVGTTDVHTQASSTQTPIAKDPEKIETAFSDLKKIDAIAKAISDSDEEYSSGTKDSDSDWEWDDDESSDDNSETNDGVSPAEDEEETSDDGDLDSDDVDAQDDVDFKNEEEQKAEEARKKALVNSIRETIEGKMTEKQKKYIDSIKDKYKSIKFDENETLEDVLNRAETIAIDDTNPNLSLKDPSFNHLVMTDFTRSYVSKSLAKDIVSTIKSFSDNNKANQLIITGFEKQDVSDQFNYVERYKFELKDKYGKSHNITFKMPKVDSDGFMYLNGTKKLLKKQIVLKPVTKTSPDDVYVMSNFNKVHIFRFGRNLNKPSMALAKFSEVVLAEPEKFKKYIMIERGDASSINIEYTTTIEYDELACKYDKFILFPKDIKKRCEIWFNQGTLTDEIRDNHRDYYEKHMSDPVMPFGFDNTGKVMTLDPMKSTDSVAKFVFEYLERNDEDGIAINVLYDCMKKIKGDSRKMMSKIEVQSFKIPLIVFLSAMYGFSKVVEVSKVKTVFVKKGGYKDLSEEDNAYVTGNNVNFIKFQDGTLYYDMYPIDASLLFNGLKDLDTTDMNYEDLDNLNTYIEFTFKKFKTRNLIRGWIAFRELFLDPKTLEIIRALHLPEDLLELLLYANSLLINNQFSPSGEISSWRIRDYEMLNTFLYESISENYRTYMTKGKSRFGFSIPEDDIITKINKSFVIDNYDQTNPANEMRERGAVGFKGPQGINSDRAFTLDKRGQTFSSIGTFSVSTPDNGNAGIVKQLTCNPNIINTLGFIEPPTDEGQVKKYSASKMMSVEEMLIPNLNRCDPRRIGFASGQTKHAIPSAFFDVPLVSTSMASAMAYKTSNSFAFKSPQDGKILKLDEENSYMIVKYKDGTTERVEFGSKYGKNSDFYLENNLVPNVKEGQTVKRGDILTYNKDFFKKHLGKIIFTQGAMARVAVTEGHVTEEDSSGISYKLANKLASTSISRKQIVLGANANIISCAKVGDYVRLGDPLMTFENSKDEDEDQALLNLLGDADESILDKISRHTASANHTGHIKDIKVYWSIEPQKMGETARKFIGQYINRIKKDIASEEAVTGKKSEKRLLIEVSKPSGPMKDRINGAIIPQEGGILIEFFITHTIAKRAGDKLTCSSSLKTVINEVFDKDHQPYRINNKSKYNDIHFIQSTVGVLNRMVSEAFLTGFQAKLVFERGKDIATEFMEEIGEGEQ